MNKECKSDLKFAGKLFVAICAIVFMFSIFGSKAEASSFTDSSEVCEKLASKLETFNSIRNTEVTGSMVNAKGVYYCTITYTKYDSEYGVIYTQGKVFKTK